jgi:hypothetical protein
MTTTEPEIWVRAVGTALAAASVVFAGYMVGYGGGKIRVNGMEHLAIFAQPRGAAASGMSRIVRSPATELSEPSAGSAAGREADESPVMPPAKIVAARPGRVWLMVGNVIRSAGPSDEVPGVGRIGAIVQRDGGWALLDDKGTTLLSVANEANGAELFARNWIFE